MESQFSSSYDVDNRYRWYKSLDPKSDLPKKRRGVRPGKDYENRLGIDFVRKYKNKLKEEGGIRKTLD